LPSDLPNPLPCVATPFIKSLKLNKDKKRQEPASFFLNKELPPSLSAKAGGQGARA